MTSAGRISGLGRWGLALPWPHPAPTDPLRPGSGVTGPVGTPVPEDHPPALLPSLLALGRTAEQAGFSSVWVDDDLAAVEARADPFSVLGALATATDSVRLGVLPSAGGTRYPAIVAKIATTVDVLSGGRAVLSLPFHPDPDVSWPIDLEESVHIARAVLDDREPAIDGAVYSVARPVNRPRALAPAGVPIAVRAPVSALAGGAGGAAGVAGDPLTLLGGHVDLVLLEVDRPEVLAATCRRLRDEAEAAGRTVADLMLLGLVAPPRDQGRTDAGRTAATLASLLAAPPEGSPEVLDGVVCDLSAISGPPGQLIELVGAMGAELA